MASPARVGIRETAICSDRTRFLDHVNVLSAGYPGPDSRPYTRPSGVSPAYTWQPPLSDDLENSFLNAPQFFRDHLCGLKGIYVNASGCANNDPAQCTVRGANFDGAWGFRSRDTHLDLGATYIAISAAALWPNGASARALDDYETQVLRSFPGGQASKVSDNAYPNTPWMSVMAALAHEAGHVYWAQKTIPYVGKKYQFDWLINCGFFEAWNYNRNDASHYDLQPPGRWRSFGSRSNAANSNLDHSMPPYLAATGLDSPNPVVANAALDQLYQAGQPWASLFGAQTPEEDFIEAYVMAVLTGYDPSATTFAGPLTSLPIIIPGFEASPPDPAKDLRAGHKPLLFKKIGCLAL
jgi:hypothetical protein